MRPIQPKDLLGKTVTAVYVSAANVVHLTFSDNTTLEVWAEDAVQTQYGNIPGIFVEDPTVKA